MRRFFIAPSAAICDTADLSDTDSRHIRKVLRLKPGTDILLFDGTGVEYEARIVSTSAERVSVSILRQSNNRSESPLKITLAQGFLKEKKMDSLIRPLTELGICRWIPYFAERSVPRPTDSRLSARVERWKTISRESLKQCGRSILPEIVEAGSFNEMLVFSHETNLKVAFWENAVDVIPVALGGIAEPPVQSVFILIGPEGGLTGDEISEATKQGFKIATLGPRILRAETATITACSLIQYLFGDLGARA